MFRRSSNLIAKQSKFLSSAPLFSQARRFYFPEKFSDNDKFNKDLGGVFPMVVSLQEPGAEAATNLFRYAYNTNQLTLMKLGLERAVEVFDATDAATEAQHKRLYEAGVPDEINYDILDHEYSTGSGTSMKDIYDQYRNQYDSYYRLAEGSAGFGKNLMVPQIMTDYYNTLQMAASSMAGLAHYRNTFTPELRPDIISGYSFKVSDRVFENTFQEQMLNMMAKLEDQEFITSFTQDELHEQIKEQRKPKQHVEKDYFENVTMGSSS